MSVYTGDPGFLVNTLRAVPLLDGGKRVEVKHGQLVPRASSSQPSAQARPNATATAHAIESLDAAELKPAQSQLALSLQNDLRILAVSDPEAYAQAEKLLVGLPPMWSVRRSASQGKFYYINIMTNQIKDIIMCASV